MFITKKNYEKALADQKEAITREWEKILVERDDRYWRQRSEENFNKDMCRRVDAIERRVFKLEKYAGFEEDKPVCPFEPKTASF